MARDVIYGLTFVGKDQLSPTLAKLKSNAEGADQSLGKIGRSASGAGSSLASMGAVGGPAMLAVTAAVGAVAGAVGAAIAAVKGFVSVLAESASAAAKVEAIEIRTLAAIRSRTEFTEEEFEALKQLNGERERKLGIDADEQLRLQGTLALMGVHANALDAATKATIGLANATGQGFNEAARVVGKALAGNTAALQEYGIKVGSVTEAQVELERLFQVAASQADTYGTRITALSHTWDGLFEAIGSLITQNPEVLRTLDGLIAGVAGFTKTFASGSQAAQSFGATVKFVFKSVAFLSQAMAKTVAASFRYVDFFWGSPGLKAAAEGLDKAVVDMNLALAGGPSPEQTRAELLEQSAQQYIEAARQAEFYRNEIKRLSAEQKSGLVTTDDATEAFKVNAFELAAAEGKMRDLEDWARKTHGTLNVLNEAATKAAHSFVEVGRAARQASKAPSTVAAPTIAAVKPRDTAPGGETWDQFTARMRKANALAREAAQMRGDLLARLEQENQQRMLEIQASAQDAQGEREAQALAVAEQAARDRAEAIKAFFTSIGTNMVSLFSEAFSSIGRLQNETTTEIVRNEEGMLEERTRITKQYIQTAGGALKQFLGDSATMFIKAALHQVAVLAVVAAADALKSAFGSLGLVALLAGPALAGAAYAMVKAGSSKIPPPPKFHVGGRVPGLMGQERLAVLQAGERVTSVADSVDNRGGGGITINNNLLVAPSRVQVERVNRDVLMPSARRLQRLGFAG